MEELKLILQTVSELGEGAKWLFILYLAKELVIYIIGFSVLGGAIIGIYRITKKRILALAFEDRIKNVSKIGSWISSQEREDILDVLKKHYE